MFILLFNMITSIFNFKLMHPIQMLPIVFHSFFSSFPVSLFFLIHSLQSPLMQVPCFISFIYLRTLWTPRGSLAPQIKNECCGSNKPVSAAWVITAH